MRQKQDTLWRCKYVAVKPKASPERGVKFDWCRTSDRRRRWRGSATTFCLHSRGRTANASPPRPRRCEKPPSAPRHPKKFHLPPYSHLINMNCFRQKINDPSLPKSTFLQLSFYFRPFHTVSAWKSVTENQLFPVG